MVTMTYTTIEVPIVPGPYVNDPPGMWTGFYSNIPKCDRFTPRMGMIHGMELAIRDRTEYGTIEEAREAGRSAAWKRYKEWQREAPELSMSEFVAKQALADMAQRDAPAHAPDDGRQS